MKCILAKTAFAAAVLSLSHTALAAGDYICLGLDANYQGVTSYVYKLRAIDMGEGNYQIVGRSGASLVSSSNKTEQPAYGAASVTQEGLEIGVSTSDIHDLSFTPSVVETIGIANVHMLLDPQTLSGTFYRINTVYSEDTAAAPNVLRTNGSVKPIACP